MNWLCWHVGTVTDPKFGRIAMRCKTSRANVIALWAMILESARDGRGAYSLDPEDAAYALDIDEQVVVDIREAMIERGLLDSSNVLKWTERQGQSNAERAREWRERQRAYAQQAEQAERSQTSPNVAERSRTEQTDRQTDTQTDILNKQDRGEKKIAPSRKREAAVVLPPDWVPSESENKFALEMGLTPDEAAREAIKFRAYWVNGKGGGTRRKPSGWSSTWQNWISRTAENLPRGKNEPSHQPERPTGWAAVIAEEAERGARNDGAGPR